MTDCIFIHIPKTGGTTLNSARINLTSFIGTYWMIKLPTLGIFLTVKQMKSIVERVFL